MYNMYVFYKKTFIHSYIPLTQGAAKASQNFLQDAPTFYQNKLAMRNTAVATGKPITV
jgi:hypothetical protein